MRVTNIISSAFYLATVAKALPPSFASLPSDYTVGNMTWQGNITIDGPEVSFSGPSFASIESQILATNPDFVWPDHSGTSNTTSDIAQRDVSHLTCNLVDFWWATRFRIEEGIEYLRGKTGRCYIPAGPKYCSRISCSYHSAIFWCNDKTTAQWVDCNQWGDYAQAVIDACTQDDPSQDVKGQQFSTDDWNIIVGYSEC